MSDPQVPESGRPGTAPTHEFGSAGWDTSTEDADLVQTSSSGAYTTPPTTVSSSYTGSGASETTTGVGAGSSSGGAKDEAKQQSQRLAGETAEGAKNVAQVAKSEASSVVAEAGSQARNLLGEARSQLTSQVSGQKGSLVSYLRSFGDDINGMVSGERSPDSENGPAATIARRASGFANDAASWLDNKEPSEILGEVTRFARRRPGLFLAIAATAGVVAGRLTRGLTAGDDDDDRGYSSYGRTPATPLTDTSYGTDTSYSTGYSTGYSTDYSTGGYGSGAGVTGVTTTGAGYDSGYGDDLTAAPGEPGYDDRSVR